MLLNIIKEVAAKATAYISFYSSSKLYRKTQGSFLVNSTNGPRFCVSDLVHIYTK